MPVETSWHSLDGTLCAERLGVDAAIGLGAAAAAEAAAGLGFKTPG